MKGLFITVEGPDGSGKSTQIEYIREFLDNRGYETIFTREPGGTPVSEKIRAIILDKNNSEIAPITEAYLYAASRAQHVAQLIGPALERGKIVVCDRFLDSSIVYQAYARGLGKCVNAINKYAVGEYTPDLTILLRLPAEEAMARLCGHKDRLESEDISFHRQVAEGYDALQRTFPERIVAVDATRSKEQVRNEVIACLEMFLAKKAAESLYKAEQNNDGAGHGA